MYALFLALPAIVFVGAGTLTFGQGKREFSKKRLTSIAGILSVLLMLALSPSCAGGFNATFGGKTTAPFSLAVMGYVTDGAGNVQGEEIFTVPLTIVK